MTSYRIVRIAHINYPSALKELYRDRPDLASRPYEDQMKAIFDSRLIYSDSFSISMRKMGNEAHELVHNAISAQKMWARQRGLAIHENQPIADIVLHQIAELKPDVVFYQGSCPFPESIQKTFKRRFPFVKLVVLYMGFPLPVQQFKGYVDYVFAGAPEIREHCKSAGAKSELVYHGFDESLLDLPALKNAGRKYDFTFAGTSGFDHRLNGLKVHSSHTTRYLTLIELLKKTNIKIWEQAGQQGEPAVNSSMISMENSLRVFAKLLLKIKSEESLKSVDGIKAKMKSGLGKTFIQTLEDAQAGEKQEGRINPPPGFPRNIISLSQMFPGRCEGPVFGLPMYEILAQSRIVFNVHTDAVHETVANMRMFEATGIGSCLLTDTGSNMPDLFEENKEVVTYSCVDDLVEKTAYLLENGDERQKIAEAGQRRTLRDHTIFRRCEQMNHEIMRLLNSPTRETNRPENESGVDVHVAHTVTTREEAKLYGEITLPNMFSNGNLPSDEKALGLKYILYTTEELIRIIERIPLFESLKQAVKVEFRIIAASEESRESLKKCAGISALTDAAGNRAALVLLTPDMVVSDGSLRKLYRLGREGMTYLVLAPEIKVDRSFAVKQLEERLAAGEEAFTASSLACIVKDCPGAVPRKRPGAFSGLLNIPDGINFKVENEGYLIVGSDLKPALTWPRSVSFLGMETLDPFNLAVDVLFTAVPESIDIHVVTDSDEMIILHLVDDLSAADESGGYDNLSAGFDLLKRLQYRYRLHDDTISKKWDEVESACDNEIERIKSNHLIGQGGKDIMKIGKWLLFGSAQ